MLALLKQGLSCSIYLKEESIKLQKKFKLRLLYTTLLWRIMIFFLLLILPVVTPKGVGSLKLPVYQNICNPCVLLIAYSGLKSKKASGVDDIPIENVTLAAILSLSLELQSKKYSLNFTKRIFIPKTNGKMRPLGIASSKDKIVQCALLMVLEPLFENVFLDSSHGFRKNRSCHTALKEIYYK